MNERDMFRLIIKPRPITGLSLVFLGLACIGLGVRLPGLLSDPLLAFLLMGLPCLFGGMVALVHGFALFCSRVSLDREGLGGKLPGWRGFPTPPCRALVLRWEQVRQISHRRENYWMAIHRERPYLPLLPVETYLVEYDNGSLLLAGNMLPEPGAIVETMAELSNLPIRERPPVNVSILQALGGKMPSWH